MIKDREDCCPRVHHTNQSVIAAAPLLTIVYENVQLAAVLGLKLPGEGTH